VSSDLRSSYWHACGLVGVRLVGVRLVGVRLVGVRLVGVRFGGGAVGWGAVWGWWFEVVLLGNAWDHSNLSFIHNSPHFLNTAETLPYPTKPNHTAPNLTTPNPNHPKHPHYTHVCHRVAHDPDQQVHQHHAHGELVDDRQRHRGVRVGAVQHGVEVDAAEGVVQHREDGVADVAEGLALLVGVDGCGCGRWLLL